MCVGLCLADARVRPLKELTHCAIDLGLLPGQQPMPCSTRGPCPRMAHAGPTGRSVLWQGCTSNHFATARTAHPPGALLARPQEHTHIMERDNGRAKGFLECMHSITSESLLRSTSSAGYVHGLRQSSAVALPLTLTVPQGGKMNFIKQTRSWRPILGTSPFVWRLPPPPPLRPPPSPPPPPPRPPKVPLGGVSAQRGHSTHL